MPSESEADGKAQTGRLRERRKVSLLLRPWVESDAPALREAIDEDLAHLKPWLGWTLEEPTTLERTRARLRRWVEQHHQGEGFRWAVVVPDRPEVILGGANLNRRLGPDVHDIGYWVRRSAARQGIASAAISRLVVHAFEDRSVDRIVAQCDETNERSMAVVRALGFRDMGGATITYPDGSPRSIRRLELTGKRYREWHGDAFRERARRVRLVIRSEDLPSPLEEGV